MLFFKVCYLEFIGISTFLIPVDIWIFFIEQIIVELCRAYQSILLLHHDPPELRQESPHHLLPILENESINHPVQSVAL